MRRFRAFVCLLVLSVAQAQADELEGLWKAKRRFGPDARGLLVIQRTGSAYSAEMVGRIVPVRSEKGELAFELPNGEGSFRGRHQSDGVITGHWFPPNGMAQNAGGKFVSPVRLKPDGPNRWSRQVVPFEDAFTFYLLMRKRPDGTIGVFLRNPERDFGAWLGVDGLVREGDAVKLIGKRTVSGTYDAENDVITLFFPFRGGSYDFRRDGDDSDFYPRGRNPARYGYRPPLAREDGWPTGSLFPALAPLALGFLLFLSQRGVLVRQHGVLVR